MLSWASNALESLSQTVAPPPEDAAGRFVYCCRQGDNDGAMQCLHEIPGAGAVVNASKGQVALHVACQYSMNASLIRQLLGFAGASIDVVDAMGNTPLHCAAMSNDPNNAIEIVKLLVTEYHASVTAKNHSRQTPYDVASANSVRQYLLPLQLQKETQEALDNGGAGLPPGIDLGGMKISYDHLPPPPTGTNVGGGASMGPPSAGPPSAGGMPQSGVAGGPPPAHESATHAPSYASPSQFPTPNAAAGAAASPQQMFATPSPTAHHQATHSAATGGTTPSMHVNSTEPPVNSPAPAVSQQQQQQPSLGQPPKSGDTNNFSLPRPPKSGNDASSQDGYARCRQFAPASSGSKYQPDGFHSSSSDPSLQNKYGHMPIPGRQTAAVPPPPSSGGSASIQSAPRSFGGVASNPYAARSVLPGRRYVAVDPMTGKPLDAPASGGYRPPAGFHNPAPNSVPSNFAMFNPAATAAASGIASPTSAPSPQAATGGIAQAAAPAPYQSSEPQYPGQQSSSAMQPSAIVPESSMQASVGGAVGFVPPPFQSSQTPHSEQFAPTQGEVVSRNATYGAAPPQQPITISARSSSEPAATASSVFSASPAHVTVNAMPSVPTGSGGSATQPIVLPQAPKSFGSVVSAASDIAASELFAGASPKATAETTDAADAFSVPPPSSMVEPVAPNSTASAPLPAANAYPSASGDGTAEASAADTFAAPAAADTLLGSTAAVSSSASAADAFSAPAPSSLAGETTAFANSQSADQSTKESINTFSSLPSTTLTMPSLSGDSASALSGANTAVPQAPFSLAAREPSSTSDASDLFSKPVSSSDVSQSALTVPQHTQAEPPSQGQEPDKGFDEDSELMDDIPLDSSAVEPKNTVEESAPASAAQSTTAPAAAPGILASIGMPPPPFSARN